jgi:hypothetical protein
LYRSKLAAWGIPVLLKYESAGPVFGITIDGLGEVAIMVPAELAAEADGLLNEIETDELPDEVEDTEQ